MTINGYGSSANGTTTDGMDYKEYAWRLEETINLMMEERLAELEFAKEDEGWVRINGDSGVEFSFGHLQRIVNRSRLFFISNPLIHRGVTLQSDYVFAQGINIQATSDLVNEVLQDFVDDPLNRMELTSHKARLLKEQTLMVDGNIFFTLFTDTLRSGRIQVRSILVDEMTDIITNPDDSNEVWYYKREWTQRNPSTYETKQMVAYYPDINYKPSSRPKTKQKAPVYWDAPVLHIKVGELSKSRYGIPETYSALDWANAHRNFLQDWATIVKAYARFAFRLTVVGGKQSVAAAKTKLGSTVGSPANMGETNPSPTTASIFTRTKDGADIEPIKTAGATTNAQDGREIQMMVASALGIPVTFFGSVDVGNLATARTLDRPTELKFRSRQQLWTDVFARILDHVIYYAVIAPQGKLNKYVDMTIDPYGLLKTVPRDDPETGEPIDLHVEITFPPILEHTIMDRIQAVTEAVTLNGKSFAFDSPELIKLTMRLMFQALGLNDVDELMDQIFSDLDLQAQIDAKSNSQQTTTDNSNNSQQDDPNADGPDSNGSTRPKSQSTTTSDQKASGNE